MRNIKIGNMSMVYTADDANTLYTMAKNRSIISEGNGLDIFGAIKNRDFQIDGKIDAALNAVRIGSYEKGFSPVDFTLGESGRIFSQMSGIVAYGPDHVIRNKGTIDAAQDGVMTYGKVTVVNSGEITGNNGIDMYSIGSQTGVVKNTGTITGEQWSIYGSSMNEKVINSGDLIGDVNLGSGIDTFIYKGGHIEGVVRGGDGHDQYYAHANGLNIVGQSDQGIDTVFARVDFELQANVEHLYLEGKGNIDGIGNSADNSLYGNAGRNTLVGGYGFDDLQGRAGNDILTGGAGADDFHFDRGTGRDTITDYEATFDDLIFFKLKSATSFEDMIENHATEKNGDVVLTFGKDVVVISDHVIADLNAEDFHFYS